MAEIPIQRKEGRNIWPMLLGLLALLAVLWFLFGRNRATDTVATRTDSTFVASSGVTTDSAAGTTANGMNGAAGATGAMASGSTGGMSGTALGDADIVSVIHAVNQGEITAGRLASTKAASSDVKAYAREMVTAHTAMDAKGKKMGAAVGSAKTVMGDSVSTATAAMSSQLQSAGSGASFDKAYLDGQVQAHQNTIAFLQRAQSSAQNADLKQMITAAIPDVQKHLARAQSLQTKVSQ